MAAEKTQITKQAILDSDQYTFQSNWNVCGISIAFLVAFMVVGLVWMLGLDALGVIDLGV